MSKRITTTQLAGSRWRRIVVLNGATFEQSHAFPSVYRRTREVDGAREVRYAWDGNGVVTRFLSEVVDAMNDEIEQRSP